MWRKPTQIAVLAVVLAGLLIPAFSFGAEIPTSTLHLTGGCQTANEYQLDASGTSILTTSTELCYASSPAIPGDQERTYLYANLSRLVVQVFFVISIMFFVFALYICYLAWKKFVHHDR